MKVGLELIVNTLAPFSLLETSPRHLVEKMPRIDTLIQCNETMYRFITTPFKLKGLPSFTGHGILELVQEDNGDFQIINASSGVLPTDNCSIEAIASSDKGNIKIEGRIEITHPLLNRFTVKLVKPAFDRIKREMVAEFEANLNNMRFKNPIHAG